MKAATGNALLINIIIVFLVIVLGLLVTSISYTKAYRIKNRIVDILEYYNGDIKNKKTEISNDINTSLSSIGYKTGISNCKKVDDKDNELLDTNYQICIYKYETNRGYYYKVLTYMYLDLPLVNSLNIPIYGETKMFYE